MEFNSTSRRGVFGFTAVLGAAMAFPRSADAASGSGECYPTRTTDSVEVLYKSPHYGANGLWIGDEGLWVIHQVDESYASLVDLGTGRLIREIQCEGGYRSSGICIDEEGVMWIGSTYNRLIVACDPSTGKALAKYSTPGAGQIYPVKGDVEGSRTPLEPAYPPPPPSGPGGRTGAGRQELSVTEGPVGTVAHCPLPKGDLLYVDVPPARRIFAIHKETWAVDHFFPTAGNRPHDMTWANAARSHLWCSDSNMNALFLHDAETGRIIERVNLPDGSPIIHGANFTTDLCTVR